jgi:hypothetical protein
MDNRGVGLAHLIAQLLQGKERSECLCVCGSDFYVIPISAAIILVADILAELFVGHLLVPTYLALPLSF